MSDKLRKRIIEIYRENGTKGVSAGMGRVLRRIGYTLRRFSRQVVADLQHQFGPDTVEHQFGNISVAVPVRHTWQRARFRSTHNESDLLEDLASEVRSDDVVLDVGAYLGWHTLVAAAAARDGLVISFEPNPESYNRLNEVVRHAVGAVRTFDIALSDVKGRCMINSSSFPGARLYEETLQHDAVQVTTATGDQLLESVCLPQPTVVKIDVEGWEVKTLRGLKKTISNRKCRLVYCELHMRNAPEGRSVRTAVTKILENAGFECGTLPHSSKKLIKATRH